MQAAPIATPRTHARAAQPSERSTAINRRSKPLPAPSHSAYPAACANFALHTMHAHRLWIKLWITLGQPEENSNGLEGNAGVTPSDMSAAHSRPGPSTTGSHSRCAHSQRALAGQMNLIPGIHRPYDDYHFRYQQYIHTKAGSPDRPRQVTSLPSRSQTR